MRDLVKKLIYSLEQSNIGSFDKSLIADASNMKSSSPVVNKTQVALKQPLLPNLLNNQSLQSSVRDTLTKPGNESGSVGKNKDNEMLMLKRLNYLRNALENHNSRETTAYLREIADRKRDDRLLELWKNDLEKPSVYELVHKLRAKEEMNNKQSSKFMQMLNSIQNDGVATPGEIPMLEANSIDSLAAS